MRTLSVHVPLGERRPPVATVRLAVGSVEMTVAVSRSDEAGWSVRLPEAEGGTPAARAEPEVWAEIEKAAVAAVAGDPVAWEHLSGKLLKRRGGR